MTLVIIGGGAAGFFAALAAKETNPHIDVLLLERSSHLLSKVRISGGGRCNVTHSCFDAKQLVKNYPRGSKELLGPFTRFQPLDTVQWFESRGVELKTEDDGRMFPTTDSSSTIIDCLMREAARLGVTIRTKTAIENVEKNDDGFLLTLGSKETIACKALIIATGSQPSGHELAKKLGHSVQEPVPSLFTFNVPTSPLKELSGIVVDPATLLLSGTNLTQTGPLLLTHWGFSGPAALKLSAWGARHLKETGYETTLLVDWLPEMTQEMLLSTLKEMRNKQPSQTLANKNPAKLPKKLWKMFIELVGVTEKRLSEISNEEILLLCRKLKADPYDVKGKTTHKEEFVTCGGVTLSEVGFKTMESRLCPRLYFAGEVMDIDAVTGGFNFQNAWTSGWIAGSSAAKVVNAAKE